MTAVIPTRAKKNEPQLPGLRNMVIHHPSLGVSADASTITKSLDAIEQHQNSASTISAMHKHQGAASTSLPEQLYEALANAKVLTSQVAMHLGQDWRSRLFAQLDDLLDVDDWHKDDKPVQGSSFETFLRTILYQGIQRRPGLGVSHRGNLIGAWTRGTNRLTLEFLPNDMVKWVLSCEIDDELERAAGETPVRRLPEVLRAFHPDRWFSDDSRQTTA